ncbi:MAG: hypothetical protein F6K50_46020 [Moorea sp. SIO3I7]|uniref:hypothetical protein n=1 Tax=unclassified Moorena TaxID=2683338 RepID=UPI0013BC860B|nr:MULTISPECIES: hypothetical protein [unclassified Moorena]NEO02451.1 hypothetical protein [Moorena sp. SIO3I7]NEO50116.1 hypothetical protein [Moorena sp. SIO4A3]NEO66618.1 hypothetical protein [Moorena sp. SIO4G2]NEQ86824.1 hypothetical protein [Moorena sp. SIO2I5]NEP29385.1 hypothetical protein [Moorena sp. SIO3I6]
MLDETVKATIQDAAQKLTGPIKRGFMAKVAVDYFDGSARKVETYLGWSRKSVQTGLHERRTGITCVDNYQARGRKQTEQRLPNLEGDIRDLVDGHAQADPKFQSTFYYARVSARAVREALIEVKGYTEDELPTRQTIGNLLNRMGYRLKKH